MTTAATRAKAASNKATAKKPPAATAKAAPRPISAALETKVLKLTDEKVARKEIAKATGLSVYRVWVVQAEHGLTGNKKVLPPSMKEKPNA